MLVLSGYFVCSDKAEEQSGPEQSKISPSSTFSQPCLQKNWVGKGQGLANDRPNKMLGPIPSIAGLCLHAGQILATFQNNQKKCRIEGVKDLIHLV